MSFAGTNNGLIYHGRILKPDGFPLDTGSVNYTLQIWGKSDKYTNALGNPTEISMPAGPEERCLLFQETHTKDMTGSFGAFELLVGAGSAQTWGSGAAAADKQMSRLFINYPYNSLSNLVTGNQIKAISCLRGVLPIYYPYNDSNFYHEWVDRELVVTVDTGSTSFSLPPMAIRSAPFALQAAQVAGYTPYNLFKIDGSSSNVFTATQHDFLWNFSSNPSVVSVTDPTGTVCVAGKILKVSPAGNSWICADDDGGAGIVTSVTGSAPLVAGGSASAPDIRMVSGTLAGETLRWNGAAWAIAGLGISDISGTIPINRGGSGTTMAPSDGQILIGGASGYVPANILAGAGVSITNVSGAITIGTNNLAPSSISLTGAANQVAIYTAGGVLSGENQLAVSRGGTALSSIGAGEMLFGNTAGTGFDKVALAAGTGITITSSPGFLTFAVSNAGGVTAVNGVAIANPLLGFNFNSGVGVLPAWSSDASTNFLSFPNAASSGTTAGLLSYSDYSSLLPKTLSSGAVFIGNAGGTAGPQYISGDAFVSLTGIVTVSGIGGYPISGTMSGATPKALIYSNNKINAMTIPTCPTNYYLTFDGADYSCVLDAGASGGAITSVSLSLPSFISVTSPVITSGAANLTTALSTQTANMVFAGPTSGAVDVPTFRALVAADIPLLDPTNISGGEIGSIFRTGAGNIPAWSTATYPNNVAQYSILMGTNNNIVGELATSTAPAVLITQTVSGLPQWELGSNNTFLKGNASGVSWQSVNLASSDVSGILAISQGGTGTAAIPTDGQILIGGTSGYAPAIISAGTGINITNTSGAITIAASALPGSISGAGTANYLAMFDGPSSIISAPVYVSSNGNVGIGTTGPISKLQVSGDMATYGDTNQYGQFEITGSTNSAKRLSLGFNTTLDKGYIQSIINSISYQDLLLNPWGGKIGIGQTTPGAALDINGNEGSPATSGAAQNGILRLRNATHSQVLDMGMIITAPWTSWIQSTDRTSLGIDYPLALNPNGGNVGIGNSNPQFALDVAGLVNVYKAATNARLNLTGDAGRSSEIFYQEGANKWATGAMTNTMAGLGSRFVIASNYSTGAYQPGMVMDGTGKVIIGGLAPTARLHLPAGTTVINTAPLKFEPTAATLMTAAENGAMEFDGTDYYLTAGGTRKKIATSTGGSDDYVLKAGDTMTGPLVNNTNSASTAVALTQSGAGYAATFMGGNVGIGTTIPGMPLEVSGTIQAGSGGSLLLGSANNSKTQGFKANPTPTSAAMTWTLPAGDGAANQVLSTNGSGVLAWATGGSPGAISGSGTANYVPMFTPIGTMLGNSPIAISNGNVGMGSGMVAPNAYLQIAAGAAAAGKAPLKLTSGTNLTTPEAGAIEFDGINLFYTTSTPQRRMLASANSWQIISANTTVTSGQRILVDTSAGTITLTLPAAPSTGDMIEFIDGTSSFGTNNLILGRNGLKIMGLAEDMTVSTQNISFGLVYMNATYGWRLY